MKKRQWLGTVGPILVALSLVLAGLGTIRFNRSMGIVAFVLAGVELVLGIYFAIRRG